MIDEVLEIAEDSMKQAASRLQKELTRIRTGRANPALLDEISIDSYGTRSPIKQVGSVTVSDARLLVIKPWDRNLIGEIEKAINNSSLGLNCNNDGVVVRVPIPPLTEERRKQLVKQAKDNGEDAKIGIRHARRDANDLLKKAEKDSEISEDDLKKGTGQIQEVTDGYVKKIDELIKKKEADIIDGQ